MSEPLAFDIHIRRYLRLYFYWLAGISFITAPPLLFPFSCMFRSAISSVQSRSFSIIVAKSILNHNCLSPRFPVFRWLLWPHPLQTLLLASLFNLLVWFILSLNHGFVEIIVWVSFPCAIVRSHSFSGAFKAPFPKISRARSNPPTFSCCDITKDKAFLHFDRSFIFILSA